MTSKNRNCHSRLFLDTKSAKAIRSSSRLRFPMKTTAVSTFKEFPIVFVSSTKNSAIVSNLPMCVEANCESQPETAIDHGFGIQLKLRTNVIIKPLAKKHKQEPANNSGRDYRLRIILMAYKKERNRRTARSNEEDKKTCRTRLVIETIIFMSSRFLQLTFLPWRRHKHRPSQQGAMAPIAIIIIDSGLKLLALSPVN